MKKLLVSVILGLFLVTGCFQYMAKVQVKTKAGNFLCDVDGEDKVADLKCDFTILYKQSIFHCNIALIDLQKDWSPMNGKGEITQGCDIIVDAR